MAIPKVIHYFWFGKKELSKLGKKCLKSWKKYCPDYEIKLWNEENFDVSCIPFVEQAYKAKKYAFVTDYARFYILNKEGGVYIETDTELLKPLYSFMNDGVFLGIGKNDVTVCVFGMEKNHPLSQIVLEYYKNKNFDIDNLVTINSVVHDILVKKYGLIHKDEFQRLKYNTCIYPTKYFLTDWEYGALNHKESIAFHYADGSWLTPELQDQRKIILRYVRLFGKKLGWNIGNVVYYLKYYGLKDTVNKCFEKVYKKTNPFFVRYCPFKIKSNKVIFSNFNGKGYGFDPKYICEKLIKTGGYTLIWSVKDKNANNSFPKHIKAVRMNSMLYYYHMATSKIWVDNVRKGSEIRKRDGQYYLQTWHGSIPLKKLEKDVLHTLTKNYIDEAIHDSQLIDIMLSSCQTRTELIKKAFWYSGDILEVGCPRNDIFFKDHRKSNEIYRTLGIPNDKKIVVYAPTFRQSGDLKAYDIDFARARDSLESKFEGDFVWIMRLHPNLKSIDIKTKFGKDIIDGSQIQDAQLLFANADVLISDYSDCLFETSLSGTPVFIYASDLKTYVKERDFYIKITDLPFALSQDNNELINNIEKFDNSIYQKNLNEFWNKQGLYEDGHAAEKVAEWIEGKCRI